VGTAAPVAGGPADPSTGVDAISGNDSNSAASITLTARSSTPVAGVPTTVGVVADDAPTAALIDPGTGTEIGVGQTVYPLVRGSDDFAVKSATLLVDGSPVDVATQAPYQFGWTPSSAYDGKTVSFQAVVTDSSGQTTTSEALTVKVTATPTTPPVEPPVLTTPTSLTLKLGAVTKHARKGTATLRVKVSDGGLLTAKGPKIRTATKSASQASTVSVLVKAKPGQLKKLRKKGRLAVRVAIRFVSDSGATTSTNTTVVLVRKR
jgi:hypothetical protein